MVNNNFLLIGTITNSFYLLLENDNVTIYQAEVEVEKSKVGQVAHFNIKAFGSSKSIDFSINYRGKLVAITGYLDVSYLPANSTPNVSLVCTSLKVLGNGNNTNK